MAELVIADMIPDPEGCEAVLSKPGTDSLAELRKLLPGPLVLVIPVPHRLLIGIAISLFVEIEEHVELLIRRCNQHMLGTDGSEHVLAHSVELVLVQVFDELHHGN